MSDSQYKLPQRMISHCVLMTLTMIALRATRASFWATKRATKPLSSNHLWLRQSSSKWATTSPSQSIDFQWTKIWCWSTRWCRSEKLNCSIALLLAQPPTSRTPRWISSPTWACELIWKISLCWVASTRTTESHFVNIENVLNRTTLI